MKMLQASFNRRQSMQQKIAEAKRSIRSRPGTFVLLGALALVLSGCF